MRKIIALLLAATLAAPLSAAPADTRDADARLAKLLEGRVAGQPQSCIQPRWARSSEIVEGRAIVYRDGNTLWVNRPQSGAETLRRDDVLVTRQYGSQLCRIDTVRLVDRVSLFPRGFVALGDFVPYRKPARD
jgi:hypothetical protein